MTERFGAGFALDESLDFDITPTGDLRGEKGLAELQKDISFQLHFFLQRFLGEQPIEETKKEVLAEVEDVVTRDSRVSRFVDEGSSVSFFGNRNTGIRVTISLVTAGNESYAFVVEVKE
jgi:hypothetical protein